MLNLVIIVLKIVPSSVYTSQSSSASMVADLLSLYNSASSPNPEPYCIYLVILIFYLMSGSFGSVSG